MPGGSICPETGTVAVDVLRELPWAPGPLPFTPSWKMPMWLPSQRMDMLVTVTDVRRASQQVPLTDRPVFPADPGKEVPVMGNDHQGRWQVAQDVDEPLPGILIQVIGGLVQQPGPPAPWPAPWPVPPVFFLRPTGGVSDAAQNRTAPDAAAWPWPVLLLPPLKSPD